MDPRPSTVCNLVFSDLVGEINVEFSTKHSVSDHRYDSIVFCAWIFEHFRRFYILSYKLISRKKHHI